MPPNGHRCLNFNFAEGGRKKPEDLLTSELRRRAASLLVNWQGEKREREKKRRQFLHASLLKRTTCFCSGTYRADIWRCTLHNSALFRSQRVAMFVSAIRVSGEAAFHLRSESMLFRFANNNNQMKCVSTRGCSGNMQCSLLLGLAHKSYLTTDDLVTVSQYFEMDHIKVQFLQIQILSPSTHFTEQTHELHWCL